MDIYNPYVAEDLAADTWPNDGGNDFQILNGYLDQVNSYIAVTSTTQHIAYAPVHFWFNGPAGTIDPANIGLLAFDGFHPNTAGHALIALVIATAGVRYRDSVVVRRKNSRRPDLNEAAVYEGVEEFGD